MLLNYLSVVLPVWICLGDKMDFSVRGFFKVSRWPLVIIKRILHQFYTSESVIQLFVVIGMWKQPFCPLGGLTSNNIIVKWWWQKHAFRLVLFCALHFERKMSVQVILCHIWHLATIHHQYNPVSTNNWRGGIFLLLPTPVSAHISWQNGDEINLTHPTVLTEEDIYIYFHLGRHF